MTKRQFLSKLKREIDLLNKEEINKIISSYEEKIDKKVAKGKKEKDVVEEFGDVNTLANNILESYKINAKKIRRRESLDANKICRAFSEEMVKFFDSLSNLFKNKNKDELLRLVCQFILIIALVWIVKIPFKIFESLGLGLLDVFPTVIYLILGFIWKLVIGVGYFALAIGLVYRLINEILIKDTASTDAKYLKEDSLQKTGELIMRIVATIVCIPIFIILLASFIFLAIYLFVGSYALPAVLLALFGVVLMAVVIGSIFESMMK